MTPFIIFALPRCGTKMLAGAISTHPDIDHVAHEFTGSEEEFREHKAALINPSMEGQWVHDGSIVKIHVYREDYVAGARSLLTMGLPFPDGVVDLPAHEVRQLATERKAMDDAIRPHCDWSVSYEALCADEYPLKRLPGWFVRKFCALVGVDYHPMLTQHALERRITLRNEQEIQCLRVA